MSTTKKPQNVVEKPVAPAVTATKAAVAPKAAKKAPARAKKIAVKAPEKAAVTGFASRRVWPD